MKTIKMLVAVALLGTAISPTFARTGSDAAAANNAARAYNSASARTAPQPESKVCAVVEAGTGSRIAKKECRTKAEWLEMGIELQSRK